MKPFFSFLILFILNSVLLFGQVEVINNPERGLWQDRSTKPIKYSLVQVFGEDFDDPNADGVLFPSDRSIWGVDTDEEGNVYALDIDSPMLVKMSPDGELLWQRGRGPGDLESAYSLTVSDSVYISNIRGTRIDVFSRSGSYIKSIDFHQLDQKYDYMVVGTIRNEYLVLKSPVLGKIGARILVLDIDDDYSIASDFTITEEPGVTFPSSWELTNSAKIIDDYIVLGSYLTYKMSYYSIDGNLVKEVGREFPKYVRPGIYIPGDGRAQVISRSYLSSFLKINKEYLINKVTWPDNVKEDDMDELAQDIYEIFVLGIDKERPVFKSKNSIDLYSIQGELLYSDEGDGVHPEIGRITHVDHEGFLYTIANTPYPEIRKYKIIIEE